MELTGKRYARRDWRRLLSTRRGTAIVALVCAVVAGGILVVAMSRYRSSVNAGANPETVFVAAQVIAKNTPGDVLAGERLFKPTQIAAKQVTAGAIADTALLRGKVAVREINPGEQLTAGDFTSAGGLAAQLAPSQRAMTINLDAAHGMVGSIHDGDHVDAYAGLQFDPGSGRAEPVLRLLMSNVPVLRAGADSASTGIGTGSNSTSNVTLSVNDSQAGELAYAADNGKVWLVLRPANATSTAPPSLITVQSLLSATKPVANGGKK